MRSEFLEFKLITQRDLEQVAARLVAVVGLVRFVKTHIVTEVNNDIANLVRNT